MRCSGSGGTSTGCSHTHCSPNKRRCPTSRGIQPATSLQVEFKLATAGASTLSFFHTPMKTVARTLLILFSLALAAAASTFSLRTIKLPLWYNGEDEKGIQILSVPKVYFDTPGNWGMLCLFDDPFEQYDRRQPTSSGLPRGEDLNMIHAYGITISGVYDPKIKSDKPVKIVIDISQAKQQNQFSIMEVAQDAALCIRDLFPKTLGVPLVL